MDNNIYTGTSGYSYDDWKGNFYPSSISPKQYLGHYSEYFNTVELNFTYYRFPEPHIFYSMCKNVLQSGDFLFSLKANGIFTHERKFESEDIIKFISSLEPLKDAGRLGSILFQFPYSFYYSEANLDYLCGLIDGFGGLETCVEFRNNSWLNEKTINCLKNLKTGFCNVDEPPLRGLLPPTSINTSETGYIRFHGRNSLDWWNPRHAYQRYDYMYKQEELQQWIPGIRELTGKTKKTFIYFNNHYKGKAPKSALMLLGLLKSNDIG